MVLKCKNSIFNTDVYLIVLSDLKSSCESIEYTEVCNNRFKLVGLQSETMASPENDNISHASSTIKKP